MPPDNTPASPATSQSSPPPLPPANQPATDPSLAAMRQELNQMRDFLQRSARPPAAPVAAAPAGSPPDKTELTRQFHKDPLESSVAIARSVSDATGRQVMAELGPAMETLKAVARSQVRSQDPELFDKYALEIEQRVNSLQPQFHQNVNVWQNAFDLTRGNHMREILDADRQATPRGPAVHISTEGGPESAGRRASPSSDPKIKLTDEEKSWASRLGLTEAQYARGKERYENQDIRGKSSWDGLLTFDSKDKRRKDRDARNRNKSAA